MLYLRSGNSYTGTDRIRLAFTDADTGDPIDLTSSKIWFAIKRKRTTADADAYFLADTDTVGPKVELDNDPTTGLAWVTIDGADWTDIPVGCWWWAAQAKDSSDRIVELGPSRVTVEEDMIEDDD